jgi:hypothetical protein
MDAVFALKFAVTYQKRRGHGVGLTFPTMKDGATLQIHKNYCCSPTIIFFYQATLASHISSERSYPSNFQLKKKIFIGIA